MKIEYLIIKEESSSCNSNETFINLLKTNGELTIGDKIITYNEFEINYSLETNTISNKKKNERYFLLTLEREASKTTKLDRLIDGLTKTSRIVKTIIKDSNLKFRVITLWDDISFYYSKEAYPLINEIENLMRKLIFKFTVINIGMGWLDEATPDETKKAIKSKSVKNSEFDLIENSLYEADFIQLGFILFNSYSSINLTQFTEKLKLVKTKDEINFDELKELVPKSNWERYFSKIVDFDGLEDKWKKLYDLRNMIAHNKPINKGDFINIKTFTDEVKGKLEKAIGKVKSIEINEKERGNVIEFISQSIIIKDVLNDFWDKHVQSQNVIRTILTKYPENANDSGSDGQFILNDSIYTIQLKKNEINKEDKNLRHSTDSDIQE